MIGILGSGFGLYGYLPAAISIFKSQILLSRRYKRVVESRADLCFYAQDIQWLEVEDDIFKSVSGLIIAKRPEDQVNLVSSALEHSNILFLILEKPLAKSPESAIKLIRRLIESPKFFRIGYTFRHAPWANLVADFVRHANVSDEISIEWKFLANHYRTQEKNWKRYVSAGGGALRFYGIQLIGYLAELGYSEVHFSNIVEPSQDEASKWEAVFGGRNMPRCKISINTISNTNVLMLIRKFAVKLKIWCLQRTHLKLRVE